MSVNKRSKLPPPHAWTLSTLSRRMWTYSSQPVCMKLISYQLTRGFPRNNTQRKYRNRETGNLFWPKVVTIRNFETTSRFFSHFGESLVCTMVVVWCKLRWVVYIAKLLLFFQNQSNSFQPLGGLVGWLNRPPAIPLQPLGTILPSGLHKLPEENGWKGP
jgi:hypothetical protein